MNDRKQHVLKKAHQLFIEKGFQATSIQDILEYSGISKGTFYNYFSSKNELLTALLKSIYTTLEKERNDLLIGQDKENIEIFIRQIEMQIETNERYKLFSLFEEVFFSNDVELKQYIKRGQLRMVSWLYQRFIDLFGENKKPYLLDCAVMFTGLLHHNIKYYRIAYESNTNLNHVVRYSVERISNIVREVSEAGVQLLRPELIESWLPNNQVNTYQQKLFKVVFTLKETLEGDPEQSNYIEIVEFIQDELVESKNPRFFLIETMLLTLKAKFPGSEELHELEEIINELSS
jgi:AcrR family transcriptional regulator